MLEGAVGQNYCTQLSRIGAMMYFKIRELKPFMGAPGSTMALDNVDGSTSITPA